MAQSTPNFSHGDVPTAGQWNSYFAAKQDALGYTAANVAGDTFTGKLTTVASSAGTAGFALPLGTAPTSPADGDMWTTSSGLFLQVAGSTVGPIQPGISVWKNAASYATTGALPASTYDNGNLGVGATLTADANGALSVDGAAVSVNQRVLVKDQAAALQNGIYVVTASGGASAPWVLTRAGDDDTLAELQPGVSLAVLGGSTLSDTFWVQTSSVSVVGTDAVTYAQFAAYYTAGTGLALTGSQFAVSGNLLYIVDPSTLPTTLPGTANRLWNNGGVLSIS